MLKLSIIVPAYNAEHTIENTLNSILRQQLEDAELIIINDGSTDSTLDIVNRIAEANRDVMPIRVISQANQGASTARNTGIRAAQGLYWANVDADDELVDGGVQAMLAAAERDGYPEMVYGSIEINQTNGVTKLHIYDNVVLDGCDTGSKLIFLMAESTWTTPWGKLFNRQFIVNNNLWYNTNMRTHEDTEFTWRILPLIKRATIVKQTCYKYLKTNSTLSRNFGGFDEVVDKNLMFGTILKNLPKFSVADKEDFSNRMRCLIALAAYHELMSVYCSDFRQKHEALKRIIYGCSSLGVNVEQYYRIGLPRLFGLLLKTGTRLPHCALLTASKISPLRKRMQHV